VNPPDLGFLHDACCGHQNDIIGSALQSAADWSLCFSSQNMMQLAAEVPLLQMLL
jgi:hypothetical protein